MSKLHLIISSAHVSGRAKQYAHQYYRIGVVQAFDGFVPKIIRDSKNARVIYSTRGLFRGKTEKSEFYRELELVKNRFKIDSIVQKFTKN